MGETDSLSVASSQATDCSSELNGMASKMAAAKMPNQTASADSNHSAGTTDLLQCVASNPVNNSGAKSKAL